MWQEPLHGGADKVSAPEKYKRRAERPKKSRFDYNKQAKGGMLVVGLVQRNINKCQGPNLGHHLGVILASVSSKVCIPVLLCAPSLIVISLHLRPFQFLLSHVLMRSGKNTAISSEMSLCAIELPAACQ